MAKRRKTAAKQTPKEAAKKTAKISTKKSPATAAHKPAPQSPAKAGGRNPDVTVQALAIAVVIVIALTGGYLYNQNAKPAGAALEAAPATQSADKK